MKLNESKKEKLLHILPFFVDILNLCFAIKVGYDYNFIAGILFYVFNSLITYFISLEILNDMHTIMNTNKLIDVKFFDKYIKNIFPNNISVILFSYLVIYMCRNYL